VQNVGNGKNAKVAQSIKPDKGIAPVFPSSHLL